MAVKVKCLPPFRKLYELPPDTGVVVVIGGRGGAKTRNVSQFTAFSATIRKKRCVVLRDEKELIRESILNEILMRYDSANANGALSPYFQRLDTGIKELQTGQMLVFSKGFRASSSDKKANLKSISDIDIAVVEEAEDIRDEEKFNTFQDGIRKEGALIVIILNTPDINHWILKRYFTMQKVDVGAILPGCTLDGYYDIIPKQIPGFVCIKTSYTDNPFLPERVNEQYRNYGNPASHLYNPHYYLTAILGYASTGKRGQIFSNWRSCTNDEFNAIEARSIFGQDFGTTSPAGLVECKRVNNRLYVRQHNYVGMTEKEIAKLYCRLAIGSESVIIADSAEPMAIRRLRHGWQLSELSEEERKEYEENQAEAIRAQREGREAPKWRYAQLIKGWNIFAAIKPPGSIKAGIKQVMDLEVFVTEDSTDLWTEYSSYIWATDKDHKPTDEPEDNNNHLIDPIRYVVSGKGRYY